MEAIEYLKAKRRMTKECYISCNDCPLGKDNNGKELFCYDLIKRCPEKAVEIVEKWAKEHPATTRQSELLKAFPMLALDCNQVVNICPRKFVVAYGCEAPGCTDWDALLDGNLCAKCRKKFWLEEIDDEQVSGDKDNG